MRDVAIVSFAQTPSTGEVAETESGMSSTRTAMPELVVGPLRASVSGPMKPFSSAVYLLLGALLLSPRLAAAARRSSLT